MIRIEPKGKALTIPMVKKCPHTKPAKGVVRMSPELISMLAAAVQDKDEWAIILKGTRSADGFEADVTSFWMPDQDRSGGHVDIKEYDGFEIVNGVAKPNDDIGVIHSHNKMGAYFSSIDEDKLNPRFPISIVVAQKKKTYLGFDYKGVGKINLPCGAKAEIPFFIQPTVGPVVAEVVRFAPETNVVEDLMSCENYDDVSGDQFHVRFKAQCGLEEPELLRADAFGSENKDLLKMVEALPRAPVAIFNKGFNNTFNEDQKKIREDDDSAWCKEHTKWDYCQYNAKLAAEKKKQEPLVWCSTHWKIDDCKGKLNEEKISAKNPNKEKGNKRKRGLLGKSGSRSLGNTCLGPGCFVTVKDHALYCSGACYARAITDSDKTINRYWCETCKDWDEFEHGACGFCATLWCKGCNQGHRDVARCYSKGDKQPDGCIIVM